VSDFIFSLNVVFPLFLLIAAGYAAREFRFVKESFLTEANKFVFRFLLPLMLFRNIHAALFMDLDFSNIRLIFSALFGVLITIVILLIIVPLSVKRKAARGSLIQGIYRSNFLIYGLPLAVSMYGDAAIIPISMLMGIIVPVYNVAAIIILTVFSEKKSISSISFLQITKDILQNPLILACIAGGIAGGFNLRFPAIIDKPLHDLATMATPMALLIMGGEFRFRKLKSNFMMVMLASAGRLVFVPLIAMIVFIRMGFREIELAVLLCLFATPTAVVSFIMADNMGCDAEIAAQIVVLTTALSAVTIFLFIFVLKTLNYL
jgi:predicted permease